MGAALCKEKRKESRPMSSGAPATASSLSRLCVHFDINETILLSDPAGGDTFEESLNKIIAKVAYVRKVPPAEQKGGRWPQWAWHDGSPLDPELRTAYMPLPPLLPDSFSSPPGCSKFYNVKELKKPFAKSFASDASPGSIYRDEYNQLKAAMKWPEDFPIDSRLCSADGYYACMPAFFHALTALHKSGRPFSVVLRTFGTDLPRVQAAINAFVEGKHPLHAGMSFPELHLPDERMWRGRYRRSDGSFTLLQYAAYGNGEGGEGEGGDSKERERREAERQRRDAELSQWESEAAMLEELQGSADSLPRVSAVMDDYEWWDEHGQTPFAGKPLWLTLENCRWRHVFFDDNIHDDANSSIVAVRARRTADAPFAPVSGAATLRLQGSALKKVSTVRPILQHGWFIEQINACEEQLDALLEGRAETEEGTLAQTLGLEVGEIS